MPTPPKPPEKQVHEKPTFKEGKIEFKEHKDIKHEKLEKNELKEHKDAKIEKLEKNEAKEHKDAKVEKAEKNEFKEHKDAKHEKNEFKEHKVEKVEHKDIGKLEHPEKPLKENFEGPGGPIEENPEAHAKGEGDANHFITADERPDLSGGALSGEADHESHG